MLREDTVFGPIRSRRLGNSLGINLLPREGKLCNFDCIYCECGWNADGRGDAALPSRDDVRMRLEAKLSALLRESVPLDSITFSGDGEPTLHPDFPGIIDDTLALRDRYCPETAVSVLTNATRIQTDTVFQALRKVDAPILKLDAPTAELCALINRPAAGYDPAAVVKAMERFEGNFILQTMFLRAPFFDSSEPGQLALWMGIVRKLRPRQVMVYTLDRPAPLQGLRAFSARELEILMQPLVDEGYNIQIRA
ncbi:MAG: radical SAM protein [Bacteroidales bacterium]|nr:radical SAM protein [Bacteroidales bacterium]